MGLFGPERKVVGPDGREWELYVSKQPTADSAAPRRLRVEALCFFPWQESHVWLTTKDHVAEVLRQIAAGLALGDVVHPLGADFRGSNQRIGDRFRSSVTD
jgi:hypothetical protein